MENKTEQRIGVIGLGYVGLTLALCIAECGFRVSGFDKSKKVIKIIKKGEMPFYEAGLKHLLKKYLGQRFIVTDNFTGKNVCDTYIIAVGSPLNKKNKPDLHDLKDVAEDLGIILKRGDSVILRSTVPIGATRNFIIPILEEKSGLKAGDDFFVSFAPERTVSGCALEELRTLPQVIGEIDKKNAGSAARIFSSMTDTIVMVDSLEEAEIVKLINNTYRDVTFGFANEVALIAQRWGMDGKKVIEAANHGYRRGGIPLPSPGVGGYCLTKDPFIFIESAKSKGYDPLLFKHARNTSDKMIDFISEHTLSFLKNYKNHKRDPKILILGVAFKGNPATSDVRWSTSISLIKNLQNASYNNIFAFDPVVRRDDILIHNIKHVVDIKKGFVDTDVILVGNNHSYFKEMEIKKMLSLTSKPVLLFDSWGLFDKELSELKDVYYKRL